MFNIFQILNQTFKNVQRILQKWKSFAKSGLTAQDYDERFLCNF